MGGEGKGGRWTRKETGREREKEPGWPSGETESQGKSGLGVRLDQVDLGTQCSCKVTILEFVHPRFEK